MNKLKSKLPGSIEEVRNLVRLNVQGNSLSELNMKRLPYLEVLNCSENALRSLEVEEGPLTVLTAKSNRMHLFIQGGSLCLPKASPPPNPPLTFPKILAMMNLGVLHKHTSSILITFLRSFHKFYSKMASESISDNVKTKQFPC